MQENDSLFERIVGADKIYAFFALDGRKNVGNKYWIVSKKIFAEYMNCWTGWDGEGKNWATHQNQYQKPEAGENDFHKSSEKFLFFFQCDLLKWIFFVTSRYFYEVKFIIIGNKRNKGSDIFQERITRFMLPSAGSSKSTRFNRKQKNCSLNLTCLHIVIYLGDRHT